MQLILIGGVPRTGKTTLAKQLAVNLDISWISTDALEAIVHSCTDVSEAADKFPKSIMRRKTNRSNDELYDAYSISKIIDSYETQAETINPAISALAHYAHKKGWGYVIEGYHVTPQLLAQLRDAGIAFSAVILVNHNPEEAIERSRTSTVKNDWVRDNTSHEQTYANIAAGIKEHSHRLATAAQAHNIHYVDMGEQFNQKTREVYELLTR